MGILRDLDKAEGDAFKVLGDGGTVPIRKIDVVVGLAQDSYENYKAITEALEVLAKNVPQHRDTMSKILSSLPAARSEFMSFNYDLDPKKPEDRRKIDQAKAIFDRFLSASAKLVNTQLQTLNELARQVGQSDSKLTRIDDSMTRRRSLRR